jgi:hypothetical protein
MPHTTGRILRSEGAESGERLRVFVAENSASDLFWLEMVFKTSRLPYSIEVVTDAREAAECLKVRGHELDLIFDAFGIRDQLAAWEHTGYFVLANNVPAGSTNCLEKPFTQQKLVDCLYAGELVTWAARLSGRAAAA